LELKLWVVHQHQQVMFLMNAIAGQSKDVVAKSATTHNTYYIILINKAKSSF